MWLRASEASPEPAPRKHLLGENCEEAGHRVFRQHRTVKVALNTILAVFSPLMLRFLLLLNEAYLAGQIAIIDVQKPRSERNPNCDAKAGRTFAQNKQLR